MSNTNGIDSCCCCSNCGDPMVTVTHRMVQFRVVVSVLAGHENEWNSTRQGVEHARDEDNHTNSALSSCLDRTMEEYREVRQLLCRIDERETKRATPTARLIDVAHFSGLGPWTDGGKRLGSNPLRHFTVLYKCTVVISLSVNLGSMTMNSQLRQDLGSYR
jgi:hypothetical protein